MNYSPEALIAFAEAAALGSFSAAARKLNKSQSTISTAIANLEADLDLVLFDRDARYPVLTQEGKRVLNHVEDILAAHERLERMAIGLSSKIEPRLTLVLSDTWQASLEELLYHFEQRYPEIELECLTSEDIDIINLLQRGRAHLGLAKAQDAYPFDIGAEGLPQQTLMGLYVSEKHPLAKHKGKLTHEHLRTYRELRLTTYLRDESELKTGLFWSAPNYLMLLEMAEQGFGWTTLPRWLVKQYNLSNKLIELSIQGWPKLVAVDVIWSKITPPGPAGSWLRDRLLAAKK